MKAWSGHQKPPIWAFISHDEAVVWLEENGWLPEQITYGSGPGQKVYTRDLSETPAEFQARVNAAVLAHQNK
jgi:hypothetical protein